MKKRLGVFLVLLAIYLPASLLGQGVPGPKRKMGENYRWIYTDTTGVTSATTLRFPRKELLTNIVPVSIDSINTSTSGTHRIWWVQVAQLSEPNVTLAWYIFSGCIPSGVDTLYTASGAPFFTYGGCPIDSLICAGNVAGPNIQVYAADGG